MVAEDLKNYSEYLNPYMSKILNNEVEHCQEQRDMLNNIVIPVLERDDVYIDEAKIRDGLTLQKYFPYKLLDWEVFLFALIAGVFYKTGDIFFKVIRIMVGRGSGKNGFIDFLVFYFISPKHGVRNYNIDLLANSETQAKVSFNDVFELIKSPENEDHKKALNSNYYCTKESIIGKQTKSELRFNTSSKRGKDSKRTGCVIYDEKHEYLSSENINTLRSGLGKIKFGREITITTDGHVRDAVLDKEKVQNHEILKEYNPLNRTLVFWCRIEDEKEWNQPDKWVKAIPSLPDFPELRSTIQQEILDMPYNMEYYPEYMAKRMNFPIGNKDIEVAAWEDILATNQEFVELDGFDCVGGVDYAKTNDFVSCVLVFRVKGKYYVKQMTFVCRQSRDLQGIKAPLDEWVAKGDLVYIDDVEISPKCVTDWFVEQGTRYNIQKIAIDNYRYSLLNSAFKEIGFDAFERRNIKLVRPNDIRQVTPIINSVFVNQNFVWGDLPIMRWFTNNTKKIMDGLNCVYGKIEPNYRKTDGFMALAAAMTIENEIKERRELVPLAPIIL